MSGEEEGGMARPAGRLDGRAGAPQGIRAAGRGGGREVGGEPREKGNGPITAVPGGQGHRREGEWGEE